MFMAASDGLPAGQTCGVRQGLALLIGFGLAMRSSSYVVVSLTHGPELDLRRARHSARLASAGRRIGFAVRPAGHQLVSVTGQGQAGCSHRRPLFGVAWWSGRRDPRAHPEEFAGRSLGAFMEKTLQIPERRPGRLMG